MLGIPYLFNYPNQFSNVSIFPITCPLLVSKFSGLVNELDSHKNPGQSDLVLEKFLVTQWG